MITCTRQSHSRFHSPQEKAKELAPKPAAPSPKKKKETTKGPGPRAKSAGVTKKKPSTTSKAPAKKAATTAQKAAAKPKQTAKKATAAAKKVAAKPKESQKKAAAPVKEKAEHVAKSAVKKVSPRKAAQSGEVEGASETVGKYVGDTVDSVISGAAAVFAGKSPFGGGRSKVSLCNECFDLIWIVERRSGLLTVRVYLVEEPREGLRLRCQV